MWQNWKIFSEIAVLKLKGMQVRISLWYYRNKGRKLRFTVLQHCVCSKSYTVTIIAYCNTYCYMWICNGLVTCCLKPIFVRFILLVNVFDSEKYKSFSTLYLEWLAAVYALLVYLPGFSRISKAISNPLKWVCLYTTCYMHTYTGLFNIVCPFHVQVTENCSSTSQYSE